MFKDYLFKTARVSGPTIPSTSSVAVAPASVYVDPPSIVTGLLPKRVIIGAVVPATVPSKLTSSILASSSLLLASPKNLISMN